MLIIYTKKGCPWCVGALNFLKEKGLKFEEREVLSSKEFYEELVLKSGQSKAPTVDLNGEILADTDSEALEIFLKNKGELK